MPRPKVHDEQLAEALLDESARMVAKGGPEALSLRKLTQSVGTSTSAVYSLYGSREALMLAVYERSIAGFEKSQDFPKSEDPLRDLFRMGVEYRRWALANPQLYPVMFMGRQGATPEERRKLADPTIDHLTAAIDRCIAAGQLQQKRETCVMAVQLWAMVHGYVSLELISLLTPEVTKRSEEQIEEAFHDLLKTSVSAWR